MRLVPLLLLMVMLSSPATAHWPVGVKRACPLGGPDVVRVLAHSCAIIGKYQMSLRRADACDERAVLPLCEREDFPVYRDFSADEVAKLPAIVESASYQEAREKPVYLRAYLIEKALGAGSTESRFRLVQEGYFYDAARTYGDPEFFAAFQESARAWLPTAGAADQKWIYASAAFARIHLKDPRMARRNLEAAEALNTPEVPFLDWYVEKVRSCVGRARAARCAPEYYITFDR
ncbi:MAG: hypothetical protein MK180_16490 [Rhodobacteraceae bacterium]|nr:hypothetical protein [Paracoccaceae bacterium]